MREFAFTCSFAWLPKGKCAIQTSLCVTDDAEDFHDGLLALDGFTHDAADDVTTGEEYLRGSPRTRIIIGRTIARRLVTSVYAHPSFRLYTSKLLAKPICV